MRSRHDRGVTGVAALLGCEGGRLALPPGLRGEYRALDVAVSVRRVDTGRSGRERAAVFFTGELERLKPGGFAAEERGRVGREGEDEKPSGGRGRGGGGGDRGGEGFEGRAEQGGRALVDRGGKGVLGGDFLRN